MLPSQMLKIRIFLLGLILALAFVSPLTAEAQSAIDFQLARVSCMSGGAAPPSGPDCGDGVINQAWEDCDGSDLNGEDCTTIGMGFVGGNLTCDATCHFDTSGCIVSLCPNGVIDAGEDCDPGPPLNLGGQDCTTVGAFTGGVLDCDATCHFDVSGCLSSGPDCTILSDGCCEPVHCYDLIDSATCQAQDHCQWAWGGGSWATPKCDGPTQMDCGRFTDMGTCHSVTGCSWVVGSCTGTFACSNFAEADCVQTGGIVTGCLWSNAIANVCVGKYCTSMDPSWYDYYPPHPLGEWTIIRHHHPGTGDLIDFYNGPRLYDRSLYLEPVPGHAYWLIRYDFNEGKDPPDPGVSEYPSSKRYL